MKLHLFCGEAYLNGYDNIDNKGRFKRDDEEIEGTTPDKYYHSDEIIKDSHLNIMLPWDGYEDNSVEEIIIGPGMVLGESILKKIMPEIKRILTKKGIVKQAYFSQRGVSFKPIKVE